MADYTTRTITEEEREQINDFIEKTVTISCELDMWFVLYAVTDVFDNLDVRRAFFDERMDMEHYVSELIRKFDAQGRRYYIRTDSEAFNKLTDY